MSLRTSIIVLAAAATFVAVAAAYRMRAGDAPDDGTSPRYPTAGRMPADFASDTSPRANAFRTTCSQCHALPSPVLHDEAGWRGVARKMGAQMAERGMHIPQKQIDLAIEYAIRHARKARSRADPSYANPPESPAGDSTVR